MVPEIDVKKSVKNKLSNDKITQAAGPVIVIIVVSYFILNKGWQNANPIGFYVFLVLVGIQTIFLLLPATKNNKHIMSGGVVPLVLYNLAYLVAFVFYVPLYSPLMLVIPLVLFLTVYFRGIVVLALAMLNLVVVVYLSYLRNGLPNLPLAKYLPFYIVAFGLTYSVVVQRAGAIDNKIRNDLLKASDRIAEEREQLNSLINGLGDAVVATDENGNIIFFNSASIKLLNSKDIKIGDPFSKVVRLFDDNSNLIDFFSLVSAEIQQQNYKNLHIKSTNDENMSVSIDISRVHSIYNSKETQGIIFLIRDITKEKSLDEERDEFAAVTSHELRTPIATAEANISLAMDPRFIKGLSESSRDRLEKAHESVIYLADLINQLAELSNLEGNNTQVKLSNIEPGLLLRQFYNDFIESATEKNLSLYVKIEPNIKTIYTGKVYLSEILQNFISNAIKYTQKGSITLSVESSKKVEGNIIFSVADTGDGIANADKNRIFHKFYRAEDYKTMQTRGTGLGLYLTLKLARFINGKIWFVSELGKGSIFYLEIPQMIDQLTVEPTKVDKK